MDSKRLGWHHGERAVVAEIYRADATGLGHRALLGNTRRGGQGVLCQGSH